MGDQVYTLKDGENIPVEPVGALLTVGWLPGVWVKWSTTALSFSGAVGTVEQSDGLGTLAGFLKTGPQHNNPVEQQSDMWTTDTRQRAGGDNHADWGPTDASRRYELDSDLQLQRIGTRIVTMFIPPTGYHRFYVFATTGLSGALTYSPGDKLYVNSNGIISNEQETGAHTWTGYVVAATGDDDEGDYLKVVAAVA